MAKIKNYFIGLFEYLKSLSLFKKILYILSIAFFIIEFKLAIELDEIYTLPPDVSYIDFYWIYSAALPIAYIIINIALILTKKINYLTLIILFILRITYPLTWTFFVYFVVDVFYSIIGMDYLS